MRKLTMNQSGFIHENYLVTSKNVYHFSKFVCSYVHLLDKITKEVYVAHGKDTDEAIYNVFFEIPYSSIREGQVIIDDQGKTWVVTWDCGEKVQLTKREIESDNLEEQIMVYIYKGLKDMTIGYRKTNMSGMRIVDSEKNIPEHIEKVAYSIMKQSTQRQKHPELLLNIPKKLIEKYGE